MNLVDEENLPRPHVAQDPGEVELLLQHGTGGLFEGHLQLFGDDGGECGLPQPGRSVEQDVVHGLAALPGGFDPDGEIFLQLGLAGEILEPPRAQAGFELGVPFLGGGGYNAQVGHGYRTNSSARRNSGSNADSAPAPFAFLTAPSPADPAQPKLSSADSTSC